MTTDAQRMPGKKAWLHRSRHALCSVALLCVGLAAAVAYAVPPDADAGGNAAAADPAPRKKTTARKPTIRELEQRLQALEEKVEAQQVAIEAARQSAVAAQSALAAVQNAAAASQNASVAARNASAAAQPTSAGQQGAPAAGSTVALPATTSAGSPPSVGAAAVVATPAGSQRPVVEQEAASATVSNPQIFAGPGGFAFQSPDGANQIRFHGEFDFDGRFYDDRLTPDGSKSTWLLRRARPIIEGTFANIFDFRFNPDFAGGKTVIQDAFVAARFDPLFVLTAGKFKEPFGLERLQLSPNNRFIELGLPSDLVPNRDLGVQISGTYAFSAGSVTYQLGYFNGVADGTSTDANATPDIDNNDDKDFVGRVFALPFSTANIPALAGLGAGVAVSYVNQVGSPTNTLLPVYKTETQRNFFTYDATRTAFGAVPAAGAPYAAGERLRVSPQAYYFYGSLGLLTEYVHESQEVARTLGAGATAFTYRGNVKPESWQLMATFLLTGDDATFGTVVPKRPFVVGAPGWGAFEVAARVSELSIGASAFADAANHTVDSWFANLTTQPSTAVAWTVGANWYLTQNVAWYLDYTVTRFDGGALDGANRPDERAFFTRFQVAF